MRPKVHGHQLVVVVLAVVAQRAPFDPVGHEPETGGKAPALAALSIWTESCSTATRVRACSMAAPHQRGADAAAAQRRIDIDAPQLGFVTLLEPRIHVESGASRQDIVMERAEQHIRAVGRG